MQRETEEVPEVNREVAALAMDSCGVYGALTQSDLSSHSFSNGAAAVSPVVGCELEKRR